MIEEQVEVIIPVVNLHTLLAGHETETYTQFEDEGFHLSQNRRFQVSLRIGVFQPEKIEDVGIAEDQVGRELVFLAQLLEFLTDEFVRLLGKRGALEKHGLDLLLERSRVPVLHATHLRVEIALQRIVNRDDLPKMSPAQLCPQCGQNPEIGEDLRESDHAEKAPLPEAPAELRLQLCTQCGHYLLSIVRPPFLQDVLPDAPPHVPVKRGEPRVHGAGHTFAGFQYQLPNLG